jgi:predicted RNase H-like HicB family nuclease
MMMVYHVIATRSGRWWALECQEAPGAFSQVARLDQAGDMIREAIAFVAEVPEDGFDVEV